MTPPRETKQALKNINERIWDLKYVRTQQARAEIIAQLIKDYPMNWEIERNWRPPENER